MNAPIIIRITNMIHNIIISVFSFFNRYPPFLKLTYHRSDALIFLFINIIYECDKKFASYTSHPCIHQILRFTAFFLCIIIAQHHTLINLFIDPIANLFLLCVNIGGYSIYYFLLLMLALLNFS